MGDPVKLYLPVLSGNPSRVKLAYRVWRREVDPPSSETGSEGAGSLFVDAALVAADATDSSVTIGEKGFLDWTHRPSIVTTNDEGEM